MITEREQKMNRLDSFQLSHLGTDGVGTTLEDIGDELQAIADARNVTETNHSEAGLTNI
jgi:hypothetical protein